jgi:coenzyme F420-reducing hydrogenase alpha subunit
METFKNIISEKIGREVDKVEIKNVRKENITLTEDGIREYDLHVDCDVYVKPEIENITIELKILD